MDTPPSPTRNDQVPYSEKLCLGAGSLAAMYGYTGIAVLAYPAYNMIMGVDAALVGLALMIPRFLDAFTDPVMAMISDNHHARWGRRRPFIVVGALLMGPAFGLIWMVPDGWPESWKVLYFILFQSIFFVFFTIFSVPYNALTFEMTPDHYERTRVMAVNAFFHKAGEFTYQWMLPFAALLSLYLFASEEVTLPAVQITGWIAGIVVLAGMGVLPGLLVRERYGMQRAGQGTVRLRESCREAFTNVPFLILVFILILNTLSGILASGIDHYILVYYMRDGDIGQGSVWKATLSSAYAVTGILSIPVITWLARRIEKRGALHVVYGLTVFGGCMKWFIFQPGHTLVYIGDFALDPWILLDAVLCGPMWVAVLVIMGSMMADICDEDELKHGLRREAMFGAAYSWLEKAAISLSYLGTGIGLSLSGFEPQLGGAQAEGTFLMMRVYLAAGPVVTAGLALVALRYYPIDSGRAARTRAALEARRGRVSVGGS